MSDVYRPMSREDVIDKYGVDPEPIATDAEVVNKDDPYIKNHLKSAAVGALSIPTDLIALPGLAASGASAMYRSYRDDTKFLEEFQKDLMTEGARDRIGQHIGQIQQQWRQQHPEATDEEIKYGTDEYLKSKQFEDFQTSQLSGTAWLQAKARDTIRRTLGDERPASERSWTEGAAEAVGGALVPGPAGWAAKVGGAAARTGGVTAAIAGSTLGRTGLKTAEVLTPLTMPYTPANVAVNAAVGVGVNQAIDYAQGRPTAFTPTPEDTAGVGTLGVITGGIAGTAAFIAAVKGRTHAALNAGQQSATDAAMQGARSVDLTAVNPPKQGAAATIGGDPSTVYPTSAVEQLNPVAAASRGARENLIDQGSMIDRTIERIHGREAGIESERMRNNASDAVTYETSGQEADNVLYNLNAMLRNMPPNEARAAENAWRASSDTAIANNIIDNLNDEIADISGKLARSNPGTQTHTKLQADLAEAQNNLTRMRRDDPDVRISTPDVKMADKAAVARAFEVDQSPHMVAFRNEIKRLNKHNLDELVASDQLSAADAAMMFKRNPLFAPIMDDPHRGKVGIRRIWAQGLAAWRGSPPKPSYSPTHASAVHKLSLDLFKPNVSGGERRSLTPMHALSALHRYTQHLYKNKAQTRSRNWILNKLSKNADGSDSEFVRNKHMQIYENEAAVGTQRIAWIEAHQLHNKWVEEALLKPGVVPQMQNGRMRLWQFADHEYAAALRHDPVGANAAMNFMEAGTNMFKFWTTGRGNFAFALKGPLYDTPIMILTRPANRVFGSLTFRAHQLAPNLAPKIMRYVPDVTAYAGMPWHAFAAFVETQTWRMSRYLGQQLSSQHSAFRALESVVGTQAYNKMLQTALKVANWSEETASAHLRRGGAARNANTIDNIDTVRTVLTSVKENVPAPLKIVWQFYTDIIDALYSSNKRQYYTQNYALMHQKYNGRVPQHVMDMLVSEARNAAGNMTLRPAAGLVQGADKIFPYLTQSRLGTYHLYRNMAGRDTYHYMLPRLTLFMSAVAASYYFRTYWNEESRNNLWNETPVHERWRVVSLPGFELAAVFMNGTTLPYSRDLYYNLTLPPDVVPIIAGTVALMQQIGWIPADATPKPIAADLPNLIIDSMTPAMPPIVQAALSQSGMRLDPQSSETRGGNWIREFGSNFRAGPQAESMTNLGQVTNSQALFLNAIFGAMGSHIAQGTDVMLHAAKYHKEFGDKGALVPRESLAFGTGLRLATGEVLRGVVSKIPDVPFMWRAAEKRSVSTPAWQYVRENDRHIRDIKGMKDQAESKAELIRREAATLAGRMPPANMLTDVALIKITKDIVAYQAPKGDLGILRKQYVDLMYQSRAASAQYNMPTEQRRAEVNKIVQQQQENLVQQQMAIKYAEQKIAEIYGAHLAPRLNGRAITMSTLVQMMEESMGTPPIKQQSQEEAPQ